MVAPETVMVMGLAAAFSAAAEERGTLAQGLLTAETAETEVEEEERYTPEQAEQAETDTSAYGTPTESKE